MKYCNTMLFISHVDGVEDVIDCGFSEFILLRCGLSAKSHPTSENGWEPA
jgi:hypothetical protein